MTTIGVPKSVRQAAQEILADANRYARALQNTWTTPELVKAALEAEERLTLRLIENRALVSRMRAWHPTADELAEIEHEARA